MSGKKQIPDIPEGLNLIDSHTHLYFKEAYPEGAHIDAVKKAIDAGVGFMVFPGVNEESMIMMEELHALFPDNTAMAAGIHPDDLEPDWKSQLSRVRKKMKSGNYIAVGEVGIDLYRDKSNVENQKAAFEEQLHWAVADGLPVIIHCREGLEETLEVLGRFPRKDLPRVLFHCFTGTPEQVRRIREVIPDAVFAINGVVTFKNAAEVREAVKEIGLENILLETDSPYLAPTPFRGSRNESSLLPYIAAGVADTLDTDIRIVAETTTANSRRFFGI